MIRNLCLTSATIREEVTSRRDCLTQISVLNNNNQPLFADRESPSSRGTGIVENKGLLLVRISSQVPVARIVEYVHDMETLQIRTH